MLRTVIVAALLLSLSGPAAAKQKADPAIARGRTIAERECASCHAVVPGAESPMPRAVPFASREMQHTAGLEGRLADLTREGHYGMPAIAMTAEEVHDLLAYIQSLSEH